MQRQRDRGLAVHLVENRSCGACSVCCVVLNVDTEQFQKLPSVPCAHLRAGGGCGIHDSRYEVCRTYHCGWRYLGQLGDDWRPDRSGVLVEFQVEGLPPHYKKRPGIRLTLVDKRRALNQHLYEYIARLIASDVPVILAVPGPPRHFPAGAFLNDALKEAVLRRDLREVVDVFAQALKGLESHHFNPVVHRNKAPLADVKRL